MLALCADAHGPPPQPHTVKLLATPPEVTASVAPNVAPFDDSGSMALGMHATSDPTMAMKSSSSSISTTRPWFCAGVMNTHVNQSGGRARRVWIGMYYSPNVATDRRCMPTE